MAGEGIKLFLSGDILTASDLNGYLMDQVVSVFDNAADRDAAFGTGTPISLGGDGKPALAAGRLCFLLDDGTGNKTIQYYDGSNWQDSDQFVVADGGITEAKLAANSVTSAKIVDGTIVNADINAAAAIAHSKLANATAGQVLLGTTSTGVVTATTISGDVTVTGAGVTSISSGVIVDADISASAAIDKTKISGTAITAADTGTVTGTMIADAAVTTAKLGADVQLIPAGVITPYGGSTAPTGWLLCHGQAVSRSTYAALYAVFSDTYGSGNGSTTFNLPDLRGRVIAGLDNMGGTAASRLTDTTITGGADGLGEVGGAQTHLLTGAESGTSAHSHNASTNTTGAHTHAQVGDVDPGGTGIRAAFNGLNLEKNQTGSAGAHSHTVTVNAATAANASSAHNNVQPTMVLNYIVKS
jgi:microcystin-dependent protein